MGSSVLEKAATRLANTIISVLSPKSVAIALLGERHVSVVSGRAYGDGTAESVFAAVEGTAEHFLVCISAKSRRYPPKKHSRPSANIYYVGGGFSRSLPPAV